MTRNSMTIVRVTDTDSRAMFIDEDTLELAMLNVMTRQRREYAEMERRRIEHEQRMLANQRRAWKEYTVDTFSYIGVRSVIMSGAVCAMVAGIMHPVISIPVSIYCLGTACVRFGVWYGNRH